MLTDRRQFLQMMASGAVASTVPESIARALAIPARNVHGSINDVQHIVILMQENRPFDHYFGTLNGVRGYGDPRAAILSTGNNVFYQPNPGGGYVLPFHPTATELGLQYLTDLDHMWPTTHEAWNNGNYDQWVAAKTAITMAYMTRDDVPYHYALADHFTICDAYHCSLLGPTDPNRIHMWTGWVGNNFQDGGPAVVDFNAGYSWFTYPEQLVEAGITWKIYQDVGLGLAPGAPEYWGWAVATPLLGNYGDNPLAYFNQYQAAQPGSPLYEGAMTGTNVLANGGTIWDQLISDVTNNTLPQVSWIVAPEAYSEHPNWPANYGAYYVSQALDILTSNPEVWSSTVLLIHYDENDGFFDHIVPPTPPFTRAEGISTVDTVNEYFPGGEFGGATLVPGPYGMGPRVALLAVSPWSRGGFVNSQVFDHTSILRFIAARFGVNGNLDCPNITPWRRSVAGDLTSLFNFVNPNDTLPTLPSTTGYQPPNGNREPSYVPTIPIDQTLPVQEPGQRRARPLPYEFNVNGALHGAGQLQIDFANTGPTGAVFQVRAAGGVFSPRTYTLGTGTSVNDTWNVGSVGTSSYDLNVYGPNGFFRRFSGGLVAGSRASLLIASHYDADLHGITVQIVNTDVVDLTVTALNQYSGDTISQTLLPGGSMRKDFRLTSTANWYDVLVTVNTDPTFAWELAGHIENGKASLTDPGIAAAPR
jgi:phospholipase C